MKYVVLVLVSFALALAAYWGWSRMHDCQMILDGKKWQFEVAKTHEEKVQGLMGRTSLCDHCGMIFVFERDEPQGFWMKNMTIPLDIYFYDSTGKLTDQALNMRPDSETGKPQQYISQPAQYVVEVAQGSSFYTRNLDFSLCKL